MTTAHFAHELAVPQATATPTWMSRVLQAIYRTQEARANREIARIAPFLPETVAIHGDLGKVTLGNDDRLPFIR